ncbi:MAG TPA: hypothetical protein VH593_02000, partial [Ktedonobacteraceae bacterium]
HSFSPHGRAIGTATVLRALLRQVDCQDIQYKAHVVDYSAGTDAHEGNVQNMLIVFKLFQPFFVQMHVASQEELDVLLLQAEKEMQAEEFYAIDFFLTVWGRKPAAVSAKE